jgi:hypothetical protein
LALLATLNGQLELGKGIEVLDKDVLDEVLENYGS